MPREIDCPDCKGDGIARCDNPDHNFIESVGGEIMRLGCPVCGYDPDHKIYGEVCEICQGTGTVTVYTEEEFQEAIKAEREECLQDFVKKLSTGYTIKECVEAIRAKDK